jgi:uncharacterized alkaline shock family protein YloU
MSEHNLETNQAQIGSIRIADEVVAIIAGLAATEVKGVAGIITHLSKVRVFS